MMMCTRCKKRPAVVFVSPSTDMNATQGYCLVCAKELGIKPVNDIMEKMGITEEQLEAMTESMNDLMSMSDDGSFEPGGAVPFPSELLGQFGMNANGDGTEPATRESQPNDKKKKENFHKSKRKHIAAYCTDLTMKARNGELDAIIGREREIERVVQILSRRTKNNPCLIGEPGVGKTAVAEGLALRIAAGEVPAKLRKKEVQLLDLTALVAGTQFRGQFESRIKGLVDEVKQDGNIILFIDEVHNLVGTGDAEGSMNAANILKPALSRGEIQVIGATTFSEYRKYIEKDAALERRFQPVTVTEPSIDDATDIIRGIKAVLQYTGIPKCVIGIENNKPDAIALMEEKVAPYDNIRVCAAKTQYPEGAEKMLIKKVMGRQVPSGKLPADVGCVVSNTSTAKAISDAIQKGMPLVERVVSVTGEFIRNPGNYIVKLGTNVQEIIDHCGGVTGDDVVLKMGGPMMGAPIMDTNVPIIKGSNGIIAIAADHTEEKECIKCGRCMDVCPMELAPLDVYKYAQLGDAETLLKLNVMDCFSCKCCEYICSSKIPLVSKINAAKGLVMPLLKKK